MCQQTIRMCQHYAICIGFNRYYEDNSFNTKPYGECVQNYAGTNRRTHYSKYNNPAACIDGGGQWVDFYSYIDKDSSKCKKTLSGN